MRKQALSGPVSKKVNVLHAVDWSSRRRIAKYPNGVFLRWWWISELLSVKAILPHCVLVVPGRLVVV
jgi:hypothetical protein